MDRKFLIFLLVILACGPLNNAGLEIEAQIDDAVKEALETTTTTTTVPQIKSPPADRGIRMIPIHYVDDEGWDRTDWEGTVGGENIYVSKMEGTAFEGTCGDWPFAMWSGSNFFTGGFGEKDPEGVKRKRFNLYSYWEDYNRYYGNFDDAPFIIENLQDGTWDLRYAGLDKVLLHQTPQLWYSESRDCVLAMLIPILDYLDS